MCFGVAAGAPDVIHGEQITPRHKMRAWLFLNSLAAGGGMDTHNAIHALSRSVDITLYAACGIVIRITYRDTLVTIRDTYRDT